jgi:hypothetical protein
MLAFQNAKERNTGEVEEDDSKGLFGEDLSDEEGDEEKKKNRKDEGKDEDDEEDDEMPNEEERKSRKAGDVYDNRVTSNPLQKKQQMQAANGIQENQEGDSDLGSDYDEKNDDTLSYDSDDDNYRNSQNHSANDNNIDIEHSNSQKGSTNRSILSRVFSTRMKPGSSNANDRTLSTSSQQGVELKTWSSQNKQSDHTEENNAEIPPLHHFYQPNQAHQANSPSSTENSPVPKSSFSNSRNISTVIDSDDELEEE